MGTTNSTFNNNANAPANAPAATPRTASSGTAAAPAQHTDVVLQRGRNASSRTSIRDQAMALVTGVGRRSISNGGGGVLQTSSRGAAAAGDSITMTGHPSNTTESFGDKPQLWCFVKTKTRLHNSNRVIKKNVWFEAKPNSILTIGRREDCDLHLDDDRCAALNARLMAMGGESVMLVADARMYRMIGMGFKPKSTLVPLQVGSVIKVGSVSLEVTWLCTKEVDNLVERFESELRSSEFRTTKRIGGGDSSSPAKHLAGLAKDGTDSLGGTDVSDDEEDVEEDNEPAVCYICWGGADDPAAQEELDAIRRRCEKRSTAEKRAASSDGKQDPNPLIRNPCGKCSGSSRYVHLQCILTWIKTSGSGHCSICRGNLPQHFSSPPPNIELKVVRHRRGHSWVGTRRFRMSFVDKSSITIGRNADAEVRLPDRSVCGVHARITFDSEKKQFFIQDCASMTGTFVQLVGQMELPTDEATYVKVGRSTLSIRLSRRRQSLIRSFLPSLTTQR